MGSVMENKLVAAFRFFDANGNGTIEKEDLTKICKQLDPLTWTDERLDDVFQRLDKAKTGCIDYSEFAVWMTGGVQDGQQALGLYETAAAKMPGDRLADGDQTDAGLDKLRTFMNNAFDITPEQYGSPKAVTKLTWMREIAMLLDPTLNPGGFRFCQSTLIERGGVAPLLGMAKQAQSDAVVIKCLEILARLAFGNPDAAAVVASDNELLPTIQTVLGKGALPEQLTALQLAQAIAASSSADAVRAVIPNLLAQVHPLLNHSLFQVLPRSAFDVLVSISFDAPEELLRSASWEGIESWLANSHEGRPVWLDNENLTVLASGFIAVNVLALPASEEETPARQRIFQTLSEGVFLEFFTLAMEAAVSHREWPAHSGAFHSVGRMTAIISSLAGLGFRRQLVDTIAPLAQVVESDGDEKSTRVALATLRVLIGDLTCLETFLTLTQFRTETLEVLHKTGEEKEATDLLSCSTVAEDALAAARATFEESELRSAPSLRSLAELFNQHTSMDGEISKDQLLQILPKVPVGPAKDVEASVSGDRTQRFGFASFVRYVYGTPTVLGWWPSLMEDASNTWHAPARQSLNLPPLSDVLFYYELGAKGTHGVSSDVLLEEVLPAWDQTTEGELVEDLFAEIRGETLGFKAFTCWMQRYFCAVAEQLDQQQADEANTAEQ